MIYLFLRLVSGAWLRGVEKYQVDGGNWGKRKTTPVGVVLYGQFGGS
jgi:hypothetical protein